MSARKRTASEIFQDVESALAMVELGVATLRRNDPNAKAAGIRNVAVFGRSVTFVLQNLRHPLGEKFDDWYRPYQLELESDPLLRFFKELRNQIEKEGTTPAVTSSQVRIHHLEFPRDLGPAPPGATGAFLDAVGGGWTVQVEEGVTEKFYAELPAGQVMTATFLESAPTVFRGKHFGHRSIEDLCVFYLGYLRDLVEKAEADLGT